VSWWLLTGSWRDVLRGRSCKTDCNSFFVPCNRVKAPAWWRLSCLPVADSANHSRRIVIDYFWASAGSWKCDLPGKEHSMALLGRSQSWHQTYATQALPQVIRTVLHGSSKQCLVTHSIHTTNWTQPSSYRALCTADLYPHVAQCVASSTDQ
jgi:hypothetical protein